MSTYSKLYRISIHKRGITITSIVQTHPVAGIVQTVITETCKHAASDH